MPTPFEPEIILERPLMAILGTSAADGSPRTAPVWYHWEAGMLCMLGSADNASTKRVSADPRVSVEITDFDTTSGRLLHLGLRGRATVAAMDQALFERLLTRYLGPKESWNPWFMDNIARIDDPEGRLILLRPDSIFTNNVSFFRTGPDILPAR
ncbi:pyridoxamine 5'-phosphate oxidase family protein [Sulfitobacter sp.]|uniref:pyridoxamine 5'-phosphate oxidase family protein n=1 Tax=Sulfitobacter sp. TaxID=1903071 RepID=UPI0030036ADF